MKHYSLMVADDEESAQRHILEDISWETLGVGPLYAVSDGAAALREIPLVKPDILILDIRMPHVTGTELLEHLTTAAHRPCVIALSGYSDFEAARKMLSSGIVVEYLLKPASEDQLFEAVYKCIERIEGALPHPACAAPQTAAKLPDTNDCSERPSAAKAAMVRSVKSYIEQHYAERVTLALAAQQIFVNASYLSKIFAEVEPMGFADYLCAVRIDHAKELLKDYTLRIYEIAQRVGYQDVKHFMKTFKKRENMTPSEYRELHLLDF